MAFFTALPFLVNVTVSLIAVALVVVPPPAATPVRLYPDAAWAGDGADPRRQQAQDGDDQPAEGTAEVAHASGSHGSSADAGVAKARLKRTAFVSW